MSTNMAGKDPELSLDPEPKVDDVMFMKQVKFFLERVPKLGEILQQAREAENGGNQERVTALLFGNSGIGKSTLALRLKSPLTPEDFYQQVILHNPAEDVARGSREVKFDDGSNGTIAIGNHHGGGTTILPQRLSIDRDLVVYDLPGVVDTKADHQLTVQLVLRYMLMGLKKCTLVVFLQAPALAKSQTMTLWKTGILEEMVNLFGDEDRFEAGLQSATFVVNRVDEARKAIKEASVSHAAEKSEQELMEEMMERAAKGLPLEAPVKDEEQKLADVRDDDNYDVQLDRELTNKVLEEFITQQWDAAQDTVGSNALLLQQVLQNHVVVNYRTDDREDVTGSVVKAVQGLQQSAFDIAKVGSKPLIRCQRVVADVLKKVAALTERIRTSEAQTMDPVFQYDGHAVDVQNTAKKARGKRDGLPAATQVYNLTAKLEALRSQLRVDLEELRTNIQAADKDVNAAKSGTDQTIVALQDDAKRWDEIQKLFAGAKSNSKELRCLVVKSIDAKSMFRSRPKVAVDLNLTNGAREVCRFAFSGYDDYLQAHFQEWTSVHQLNQELRGLSERNRKEYFAKFTKPGLQKKEGHELLMWNGTPIVSRFRTTPAAGEWALRNSGVQLTADYTQGHFTVVLFYEVETKLSLNYYFTDTISDVKKRLKEKAGAVAELEQARKQKLARRDALLKNRRTKIATYKQAKNGKHGLLVQLTKFEEFAEELQHEVGAIFNDASKLLQDSWFLNAVRFCDALFSLQLVVCPRKAPKQGDDADDDGERVSPSHSQSKEAPWSKEHRLMDEAAVALDAAHESFYQAVAVFEAQVTSFKDSFNENEGFITTTHATESLYGLQPQDGGLSGGAGK